MIVYNFSKENKSDLIYDVSIIDRKENSIEDVTPIGAHLFSFDKKKIFNFFRDYPQKLTKEQIELFRQWNPDLAALKDKPN